MISCSVNEKTATEAVFHLTFYSPIAFRRRGVRAFATPLFADFFLPIGTTSISAARSTSVCGTGTCLGCLYV